MDSQFTPIEQEAIAQVLFNLVKADFKTREDECSTIRACLDELGFEDKGFVVKPLNELQKDVYETLKEMTMEKKRIFSRMMTQVSRSDGYFGAHEKAFVTEILEMCNVPFVQK